MTNQLAVINQQVNQEIQEFFDLLDTVNITTLDDESKNDLSAILLDFQNDIRSLENVSELAIQLEAALQIGMVNSLRQELQLSSEMDEKLNQDMKVYKTKNNITHGKLQRD